MNYSAMIQNRKSVRAFRGKEVPNEALAQLRTYYEKACPRLVPEIDTELIVLDKDAQPALESSAGYQQFLIGAPHYLLLMSARHIHAGVNAGYMMEDLVLKLTELDIDTCWLTFTDSDKIKKALSLTTPLQVAAIAALEGDQQCVRDIAEQYRQRRNMLVKGLHEAGWMMEKPKASMYIWAKIPEPYAHMGSLEFAKKLLLEAKVGVSPGLGFGDYGDDHVRFALIENQDRTRQAIRGIKAMFRADGLLEAPPAKPKRTTGKSKPAAV